jgi:amicyanin
MRRQGLFERRRWAALLLAVGCLFAALPARAEEVKIDNFTFDPPEITVSAGTTITWLNEDDIPHTVVAKERAFRSKTLDTDDKYSFTFTTPGVYDYFCSLHPHMVGKIIVRAQTGEGPGARQLAGASPHTGESSHTGVSPHTGHH